MDKTMMFFSDAKVAMQDVSREVREA